MAWPGAAVVDWGQGIRPLWAGRLALVAVREGADPELAEAWRLAIVACRDHGWQIRAVVPLREDPNQHRWALVIGRSLELDPPNLALIHGNTVAQALQRGARALEQGIRVGTGSV